MQIIYLISNSHPEFIKNSYNPTTKKANDSIKKAKDLNRLFSKGDMQIAHKHMKRYSTSVLREMQLKTTMRYN